jgi:hypothetical protein
MIRLTTRLIMKVDGTYSPANDYMARGKRDKCDFEYLWRGFMQLGGNSEIIAICQNNGVLKGHTYFAIWVQASAI